MVLLKLTTKQSLLRFFFCLYELYNYTSHVICSKSFACSQISRTYFIHHLCQYSAKPSNSNSSFGWGFAWRPTLLILKALPARTVVCLLGQRRCTSRYCTLSFCQLLFSLCLINKGYCFLTCHAIPDAVACYY